jgi:tRNA G10  N-methylase Trm11
MAVGVQARPMPHTPPLLALFYARVGESRLAELEAVAERLGAPPIDWGWDTRVQVMNGGDTGPRVVQWLPPVSEADRGWLADAAAQSVGCRGVFEVWGQGESIEACAAAAAAVPAAHVRARVQGSWRVESLTLGARKSQHPGSLGARMAAFGPLLDILDEHPVDLSDPEHRLWLVEDRQRLKDLGEMPDPPPRHLLLFQLAPTIPAIQARLTQLALPRRAFLSTSTLPAERALLLCNLALARAPREGATVLDPYCGSGGVLLAAAALGARTVGSDLDWRMVSDNRWPIRIPASPGRPERGVERVRMRDNFVEAGLPEPEALLTLDVGAEDAAARLLQANGGRRYDALVCDPPYGRREFQGGEDAWAGELTFRVDAEALGGTLTTLVGLARDTLTETGRLVFLAPVRSPKDPSKPPVETLRTMLEVEGRAQGMTPVHLAVEVLHRGLHRAVVAMDRVAPSA